MIEQIIEEMQNILIDAKPYFYRTQQGTVCDLILEHSNYVKAKVEIKFSTATQISKGFRITMADTHIPEGFVIA